MGIRSKYVGLIAAAAVALCAASADAAPIRGSFAIFGDFLPVNAAGTTSVDASGIPSFDGATAINFLNLDGTDSAGTGEFFVQNATLDFLAVRRTTGTIADFSFTGPGSAAYPTVPLLGFETLALGDLTFDLNTIGVRYQDGSSLTLNGTGVFNWAAAGFDPTPGYFTFTGNNLGGSLSFSASETTPTPEPASLFLMGTGAVAGFGSLRRRFRRNVA